MTGTTVTLMIAVLAFGVAIQDMPLPEKVTILSLLAFVLASVVWLLRSIGGRMITAVDLQTATIAKLVAELHVLTEQSVAFRADSDERHAASVREHDKDMADLKETIRDAIRGRGK